METVDCLIIGHNEMPFEYFEKMVGLYGKNSGFYRDNILEYVWYKEKPYTAAGIYNVIMKESSRARGKINDQFEPFSIGNIFSPTIAYLGTYLHRSGLTFDFINSFQEEKELLVQKLKSGNIRSVAITTTFYLAVYPINEIIKFIKECNNDVKIIIGGPFILSRFRTLGEAQLKIFIRTTGADFYVNSSQGEAALVKILYALKNGLPFEGIDNLTYRLDKRYFINNIVPEENRLEENLVNWDLFKDVVKSFVSVRTAISCPYSCAFCNMHEREGKYQTISVEAVEKELGALHKIGKVKWLDFIDDTFNIPAEKFKNIMRMMIRNRYDFKWISYFRYQQADPEMIQLMKDSGCQGVYLGVESGNQQILQNMNKNADIKKYYQTVAMLKKAGIVTYVSIIIGFPGETMETARETIKVIEETGPDFINANIMYFDLHTPIWREREKYNIRGKELDWAHSTMDSVTACNIIDDLFLNLKNSIWVPEYNFEFPGIFNLMNRGMTLNQVKNFLICFNECIKEGLKNQALKGVSFETIEKLKNAVMVVTQ